MTDEASDVMEVNKKIWDIVLEHDINVVMHALMIIMGEVLIETYHIDHVDRSMSVSKFFMDLMQSHIKDSNNERGH